LKFSSFGSAKQRLKKDKFTKNLPLWNGPKERKIHLPTVEREKILSKAFRNTFSKCRNKKLPEARDLHKKKILNFESLFPTEKKESLS